MNTSNLKEDTLKINEKSTIEERKNEIAQFISNNSNENGVDLKELYFGRLIYEKDKETDPIDQSLANKITIVYVVDHNKYDPLYMDLFKARFIQKTTYIIPGVLSFAPFTRKGLSVMPLVKLSDVLNIERLPIEKIEDLYHRIEQLDYYAFLEIPLDDLKNSYENESNRKK